jgi:hypothetical protein
MPKLCSSYNGSGGSYTAAAAATSSASRPNAAPHAAVRPIPAQSAQAVATQPQPPTLPTYEVLDYESRYVYEHFLSILDDPASFHHKLRRRISRDLVPLYLTADKTLTLEVREAGAVLVLDLLDYIGCDIRLEQSDYRILLRQWLGYDNDA